MHKQNNKKIFGLVSAIALSGLLFSVGAIVPAAAKSPHTKMNCNTLASSSGYFLVKRQEMRLNPRYKPLGDMYLAVALNNKGVGCGYAGRNTLARAKRDAAATSTKMNKTNSHFFNRFMLLPLLCVLLNLMK